METSEVWCGALYPKDVVESCIRRDFFGRRGLV